MIRKARQALIISTAIVACTVPSASAADAPSEQGCAHGFGPGRTGWQAYASSPAQAYQTPAATNSTELGCPQ